MERELLIDDEEILYRSIEAIQNNFTVGSDGKWRISSQAFLTSLMNNFIP